MPNGEKLNIKTEKIKEGFSVETKKTISSTLTEFKTGIEREAGQKLLTDYEKNNDIPQGTKEKISQLKKEKKDDGTIFKKIDGWGLLGEEGKRNERIAQVSEMASKIDIDKLSPQAKKLILGNLNSEAKYLNLLHKEAKDAEKKRELESRINSLKEARKELAGNIAGEDFKKTEEEITKKVTDEKRGLEEEISAKKISITNKEKEFREMAKKPKRTGDEEVKLAKMRNELENLRENVRKNKDKLDQTNVSTVLEEKFQEIEVLSEKDLKEAEDEILKKRPPEGPPLEEKEKKFQPVKVEQESPWVAFRDDEEFLGKWARVTEVSSDTRNTTDVFLKKGIEDVKFDFASVWAKKHKTEIKDKTGFDPEKVDKKTLTGIVEAMKGFKELKENSDYAKYSEKIDDLAALRAGWTTEGVRHNVAIGTLNEFHYREEKLNKQLEGREEELKAARKKLAELRKGSASYDGMKEVYDKATKDARDLQAELKSLSSVMKEITTATTGRDLTKEAYNSQMLTMEDMAKNLGTDSGRESYMRKLGLSWEVTPAKLAKQSMFDRIRGKEPRIVREKTTTIYDKDSNEVGVYKDDDLEKFLFEKFRDDITGEFIGAEMKEIATSPEKAKEGIKELYRTMKKDLVRDFAENKLKKELKGPKALERIRELSKEKGINCRDAIDATLGRETAYKDLTCNLENDAEAIIKDTKRIWGVDISRDRFGEYVEANPLTPEVIKGNMSWLVYLIKMIFGTFLTSEKNKINF